MFADVAILSTSRGNFDFMMTDEAERICPPGDTQQSLKITTVCPAEGWGMRVVRKWRKKWGERGGGGKGEDMSREPREGRKKRQHL